MLDLGTSFLASVARDPNALAIVDGDVRLTYRAMVRAHLGAGGGLRRAGARDRATIWSPLLQNRWEAATMHWACQFAGIIVTPLNWRATADELDYCSRTPSAKALVYEEASAPRGRARRSRRSSTRASSVGVPDDIPFDALVDGPATTSRRASTPRPGR